MNSNQHKKSLLLKIFRGFLESVSKLLRRKDDDIRKDGRKPPERARRWPGRPSSTRDKADESDSWIASAATEVVLRPLLVFFLLATAVPSPAITEQAFRHRDSEISLELTYPNEFESVPSDTNGVVLALRRKGGGFPTANLLRSWVRLGSRSNTEQDLIQRITEEYGSAGLPVTGTPRILDYPQLGQTPRTVQVNYQDPNSQEMMSLVTRWQLGHDRELILTIVAPPRMASEAQALLTTLTGQFKFMYATQPSSQDRNPPEDSYWTNSGAFPFTLGVIGLATVLALVWRGIIKARSSGTP